MRSNNATWVLVALLALMTPGCHKKKGSGKGSASAGLGERSAKAGGGPSYTLQVTAPEGSKVGEALRAKIRVTPAGEFKMNLEYPTKLQVQGPAGVAVPERQVLKAKQATRNTEAELLLEPSFKVNAAGSHAFTGALRFSVCTEQLCEFKNIAVKWVAKASQ